MTISPKPSQHLEDVRIRIKKEKGNLTRAGALTPASLDLFRAVIADGADDAWILDYLGPVGVREPEARKLLAALRRSKLTLLSVRDVQNEPPPKWLIPDVIEEQSLVVLYGAPGSGKSFVAWDIAASVATGHTWHGSGVEKGGVVYVAAEGYHGLGTRSKAWEQARLHVGSESLKLVNRAVNLTDDYAVGELIDTIRGASLDPALVVFDTLHRCMAGADENSGRDMGLVVAAVDRIREELGAAVLLIHHTGKDVSKAARGHSSLLGAADTMLELRGGTDALTLHCSKQKNAAEFEDMAFRMVAVPDTGSLVIEKAAEAGSFGQLSDPGRRVLSELLDTFDTDGATSTELRQIIVDEGGMPRRTFFAACKELAEREFIAKEKAGRGSRFTLMPKGVEVMSAECSGSAKECNGTLESESATVQPPLRGGTDCTHSPGGGSEVESSWGTVEEVKVAG